MSGDVSIGVMLTVERAFETGHPENTLLIQLCLDSPKETSIGEYIRPRARAAPAALQLLQKLPLRVVNSSAVKLGAAHTPSESLRLIATPPRAGVKRAPGPSISRRAKAAHSNPKKNM